MSMMTATYSPDDNKLRLTSVARLDNETFARVRDAGFRWAPKQGLFVAPAWSPEREDLLIELAGEIEDDDRSLVERAEERAGRFEDYSDKRAADAHRAHKTVSAIADNIPLGQPILIGHHSERHARKDAERIENGMRRAVKMWETSTYWTDRAEGALAHAKYKELPAVRARRIKGIEADLRKIERTRTEALDYFTAWQAVAALNAAAPETEATRAAALRLAGNGAHVRVIVPKEFNRSPYGPDTAYDALRWETNPVTVAQVCEWAANALARWSAPEHRTVRWLAHYANRLAYERAMLAEQGGLASDRHEIMVGGTVLVGGQWLTVLRVNKSGGKVVSVTTNSRYVRVKGIEEVTDYHAPDAEQAATVKAATSVAPLANYPGEGFRHITQAQWDAIPKGYKGNRKVPATQTASRHRVRCAIGVYLLQGEKDCNKTHSYHNVFITDAKQSTPKPVAGAAPAAVLPAPRPAHIAARPIVEAAAPNAFDSMREQLRTGIQVVAAPQLFPTPPALARRMVDRVGCTAGKRVLEPSAGTGNLVDAIRNSATGFDCGLRVVAVEINAQLADALCVQRDRTLYANDSNFDVRCADFLQCKDELGKFHAVVMNPPFHNGADIAHIQHALTMLKPGGRLVALCANGPKQQQVLRPLVEEHGGDWEELPADTFKEAGTAVRTVLLSIDAPR